MEDFCSIVLDKETGLPIYQQLGEALCRLIETGKLKPNSKLPPIRQMASCLKVNNVTVVAAYKYLENKKAVYSQVGSGTYVSPLPLSSIPEPVAEEAIYHLHSSQRYDVKGAINFGNTAMPESFFPVDEFKEAFEELLERERGNAFSYQESQGYLPLRESLCIFLQDYGIKAQAENLQIISGAQQGIDIVAKAMIQFGDVVFIERPSFYGAAGAFLSRGAKLIEIHLEKDGLDLLELENLMKLYRPKFLYLMAYFQTPTGISYSLDKKRRILDLAEKYDCYIVEDDNLYDFNYSNQEIIPFKALDYKNRVLYIKSFSKILMPGLRIGCMLLPKKIMYSVTAAKYTTDISTSGFLQKAFDLYLRNHSCREHIEVLRKYSMKKYAVTVKWIDRNLQDFVQYHKPQGGISIWLELASEKVQVEALCNALLGRGVIISPGNQFFMNGEQKPFLRLSFANVPEDKIEMGIRRMKECMEKLFDEGSGQPVP